MKKSYFIAIIIFIVIALFAYSLIVALSSKKQVSVNSQPSGPTLNVPIQSGGTIPVSDFTKNPQQVLPDTTVIQQDNNFSIVYFTKDQAFLITILSEPAQASRILAEQEFLDKLGISQIDACKLTVSLTVPAWVNANLASQDWGLSFCPNGQAFPSGN